MSMDKKSHGQNIITSLEKTGYFSDVFGTTKCRKKFFGFGKSKSSVNAGHNDQPADLSPTTTSLPINKSA